MRQFRALGAGVFEVAEHGWTVTVSNARTGENLDFQDLVLRSLCIAAVLHLPRTGLLEVAHSLVDAFQFYSQRTQRVALPGGSSVMAALVEKKAIPPLDLDD